MDFKPLITLLAIVNPLACVAFFIHYTQSFSPEQRRHTILISSCSAFAVIAASALLGVQILEFFGVSLASFQVGGGMLLRGSGMRPVLQGVLFELNQATGAGGALLQFFSPQ